MSEVCVAPISVGVVPLAWVKNYLKVDHSDDDALIQSLINSAQGMIENYARVSLTQKRWRKSAAIVRGENKTPKGRRSDTYWGPIVLSINPFVEIVSVTLKTCRDSKEIEDFKTIERGSRAGVYLARHVLEGDAFVSVDFVAGYSDVTHVPSLYKDALCLAVHHLYQARDSLDTGLGYYCGLPTDVCAMLNHEKPMGWLS